MTDLDLRLLRSIIGKATRVDTIRNRSRAQVFRVWISDHESFAVKLYPPEHELAAVVAEVDYARASADADLPHVQHVNTDGQGCFRQLNGWYLTAYRWLPGKPRPVLDDVGWAALVELVAGLHRGTQHVRPAPDQWLWDDESSLVARVTIPDSLATHVTRVVGSGRPWSHDQEHVVAHNDLLPDNLVWAPGCTRPVPIDLSNIIRAPREWELGVLWAGSCLNTPTELLTTEGAAESLVRILRLYESFHVLDAALALRLAERALAQRALFLAWVATDPNQVWQRAALALCLFDPGAPIQPDAGLTRSDVSLIDPGGSRIQLLP
jgi:Ser/Thr protein kinase RdoA (MazF antagonist)